MVHFSTWGNWMASGQFFSLTRIKKQSFIKSGEVPWSLDGMTLLIHGQELSIWLSWQGWCIGQGCLFALHDEADALARVFPLDCMTGWRIGQGCIFELDDKADTLPRVVFGFRGQGWRLARVVYIEYIVLLHWNWTRVLRLGDQVHVFCCHF